MSVRSVGQQLRPGGSPTRRIAKASIRTGICGLSEYAASGRLHRLPLFLRQWRVRENRLWAHARRKFSDFPPSTAFVLGRENFLFAGIRFRGQRAAAMYRLIGSAKLNGLDPEACFREVLARNADHPINR